MTKHDILSIRAPDPMLLLLGLAILSVGIVAIASASIEYSQYHFGDPWYHTQRHALWLLLGVITGAVAYMIPTDVWGYASPTLLLFALVLLVLVLMPGIGHQVNGAQRWLALGPLTFQPSEVSKFSIILYTAGYLVRQEEAVRYQWQGLVKLMGILSFVAILLLLEPDFGATVIVMGIVIGMMFIAGAHLIYISLMLLCALLGMTSLILSVPYRLQRLTAYQDPWADPFGSGFQLIQSLIAFGRGEWLGVGLGNSVQKLFYLPEAHTDFVFSIWTEETGLIGGAGLILLFTLLIGRIIQTGWLAATQQRVFEAYVCFGTGLMFAGQAFVNIGASVGLLPTKGLTLPFISYGGSSLLINCALLGIVLRVAQCLGESISPLVNERGLRV